MLMYGVGVLVEPRVGISLMLGSILAWALLVPVAFDRGWVPPGANEPDALWFTAGLQWLLWPGVSMMVLSALTSFAFSWRSILAVFRPGRGGVAADAGPVDLPRKWFLVALVAVSDISVILQVLVFQITAWVAVFGIFLTFILALVVARVSGETNITPVGAMGKVTQLFFAVLSPGQPAANLMSANVTGGAASQCADLMHDLKTGYMLGTPPRSQFIAQFFGALAGALAGSAGYLVLIKVIPAYNSISMFLGSLAAWCLGRWVPDWTSRFVLIIACGIIAGESLSGVVLAIVQVLKGY